jgi:radical SAM-linked protein
MRGDTGFPVRLRFGKRGKVRFISHRDVARAFERAFRIEQLPLAFTEGFSPRPKVSFGLALSVGHESDAEYLDVELTDPVDSTGLPERLSAALPEGIDVTGAVRLTERAPALQESVSEICFRMTVADRRGEIVPEALLREVTERALASDALPVARTRKGRESIDDLRPTIRDLSLQATSRHDDSRPSGSLAGDGSPCVLELVLSTRPRGARPREVLDALDAFAGVGLTERRVVRMSQWIERDGARLEPLAADAFAPATDLEARAS